MIEISLSIYPHEEERIEKKFNEFIYEKSTKYSSTAFWSS